MQRAIKLSWCCSSTPNAVCSYFTLNQHEVVLHRSAPTQNWLRFPQALPASSATALHARIRSVGTGARLRARPPRCVVSRRAFLSRNPFQGNATMLCRGGRFCHRSLGNVGVEWRKRSRAPPPCPAYVAHARLWDANGKPSVVLFFDACCGFFTLTSQSKQAQYLKLYCIDLPSRRTGPALQGRPGPCRHQARRLSTREPGPSAREHGSAHGCLVALCRGGRFCHGTRFKATQRWHVVPRRAFLSPEPCLQATLVLCGGNVTVLLLPVQRASPTHVCGRKGLVDQAVVVLFEFIDPCCSFFTLTLHCIDLPPMPTQNWLHFEFGQALTASSATALHARTRSVGTGAQLRARRPLCVVSRRAFLSRNPFCRQRNDVVSRRAFLSPCLQATLLLCRVGAPFLHVVTLRGGTHTFLLSDPTQAPHPYLHHALARV